MNKKLSELSKPVATVDVQRGRQDGNIFVVAWSSAGHALPDGPHFTYSQEYVSALLADNEGMEQTLNVANDAIRLWKERALAAEAKLATPVRLPKTNGYWTEQEKAFEDAITLAKRAVRLAGFTVEGDE